MNAIKYLSFAEAHCQLLLVLLRFKTFKSSEFTHITHIFEYLHWLHVPILTYEDFATSSLGAV